MTASGTGRAATLWNLLQLTAALYQPPREALRGDLEAGNLHHLAVKVAHALRLRLPLFVPPTFEALQARYVALFITNPAGVSAPPYTGYALDDTLLGPSVQALRAFLLQHGLSLREGWRDLPDHVAAVAEAGLLLFERERYDEALELSGRFLLPWFARYSEVLSAADPDFYGPLSQFLYCALKEVTCEVAA